MEKCELKLLQINIIPILSVAYMIIVLYRHEVKLLRLRDCIQHKLEQSNMFINDFYPAKDNGRRLLLTNVMTKSTDEEHGIRH